MSTIKGVRDIEKVKYSKRGRKPSFVVLRGLPENDWPQGKTKPPNDIQFEAPKLHERHLFIKNTQWRDMRYSKCLKILAQKELELGKETFFDFLYSNDLPLCALYDLIKLGSVEEIMSEGMTIGNDEYLDRVFKGWVKSLRKGK